MSGLHSKEELIEAISIPQREFAKASMHHHHVVSFEIDKDLPQRLVDDLLATKGAASALPILQLVCRELYAAATARAAKDGNQIRLRTADLSKGVAGIVDEYIDQKIRLLGSVSTEKWRGVLASLVGRQEGGVLITLLTPLSDLTKRCQAAGLRAPGDTFRPYLDALCASGVLRSVNYGELKEPEYSLGHDALAPYLYRWHQQQLTERAASERYRRWTIAASVLIVAAAAAFYSLWYVPEKQKVELLVARENAQFLNKVTSAIELASSDSISDASAKLGPALWALAQFSGAPLVHSELHDETRATLSSLLLRSPVASGCVDAIGVQDPLNVGSSAVPQLAFLNEAESCNDGSRDVSRPANVNSLTLYEIGGDKLLNRRRVLTLPSTEGAGNSGTGFPPIPFVGFVKPKNVPVVIADGVIRSANPTGEFTQSSTSDIFGDLKTRFLLFDNSVGALWAMGPTSQDNRSLAMQRADFDNAGDQLKAGAATNVPLSSPIWPVLSPWNDWLADIEQKNSQDSELHVRNRAGGHLSSWNLPSTSWPDPTSFVFLRNQPIRPIGFVRNKSWVAVRTGPNNINLYDVKDRGWAPVQLELPPEAAEDPLRPAWFNRRPTMAGVFSDGVLTLAWATRRGIEVVRWQLPSRKGKATAPLVYSPDPGSTVTDLRFLPSDVLEIVIGEPGTFAVGYRLMDLNRERGEALAHMSDSDLMRVSCSRLKVSRGRSPQIDKVCNSIGG
nr:hypothetical protein [Bradyrhizobium cosmicum]